VLKLSRRTVRKYLEPASSKAEKTGGWEDQIDWDYVRQEVGAKGTTIKQYGGSKFNVQSDLEAGFQKVPVVPIIPLQSGNQKLENVRDVANSPLSRRQQLPSNHIDSFCTPVYTSLHEIVDQ
jgi:hypothetical protein